MRDQELGLIGEETELRTLEAELRAEAKPQQAALEDVGLDEVELRKEKAILEENHAVEDARLIREEFSDRAVSEGIADEAPSEDVNEEEVIESLREYLPKLHNGLAYILDKYRTGHVEQADSAMPDAIEGLKWVVDVMEIIYPEEMHMESLNETFGSLLDAMENKDVGTIADVIEFEIFDLVKIWSNICNSGPNIHD